MAGFFLFFSCSNFYGLHSINYTVNLKHSKLESKPFILLRTLTYLYSNYGHQLYQIAVPDFD